MLFDYPQRNGPTRPSLSLPSVGGSLISVIVILDLYLERIFFIYTYTSSRKFPEYSLQASLLVNHHHL